MFVYPKDYEASKRELKNSLFELKKLKHHIFQTSFEIYENHFIDKITIKSKKELKNRVILTAGLHGIEGYIGHAAIINFLDTFLPNLTDSTEVVIYHVLNPYGMKNYARTNENNVDLNRNFSQNNFTSTFKDFLIVKDALKSKVITGKIKSNSSYYATLANLMRKHGAKKISDAVLYGQNLDSKGIYYCGNEYELSNKYIISEMPQILSGVDTCIWLDIHSGYGPRYQMSIINSQFEKEKTKELFDTMKYPLILGLNKDDFYDVEGDILEYVYSVHTQEKCKSDLIALCYEFGTLGDSTKNTIESLKAIVFENNKRFNPTTSKMEAYVKNLMMEQFLPSEEKWRIKAEQDFIDSTTEILNFKNLFKKNTHKM